VQLSRDLAVASHTITRNKTDLNHWTTLSGNASCDASGMGTVRLALIVLVLLAGALPAVGQDAGDAQIPTATATGALRAATAPVYRPPSALQREKWVVEGIAGGRGLGVGALATSWQTGWNTPQEWGRTLAGSDKRFLAREADVAISNTIEAGLGALWGEDPRYIRASRGTVRSRVAWAAKTVLLAPRPDGHLAPAWGRYAGNVVNNVIENTYLPRSITTPKQTVIRSVNGLVGRLAGNLFDEFWPEIRQRFRRKSS
jgi:hypothetical protein